MKAHKIFWGLFNSKHWYHNIKDIWRSIKRIAFILKHGYSEQALWETYYWFIGVMNEILDYYRHERMGTPVLISETWETNDPDDDRNDEAYDALLDHMKSLLSLMDEMNPIYDNMDFKQSSDMMEAAKDEFFKLFSKHFYAFWD